MPGGRPSVKSFAARSADAPTTKSKSKNKKKVADIGAATTSGAKKKGSSIHTSPNTVVKTFSKIKNGNFAHGHKQEVGNHKHDHIKTKNASASDKVADDLLSMEKKMTKQQKRMKTLH